MTGATAGGNVAAGAHGVAKPSAADGWPAAPPVGLYVHVPFCVSVCPYCDFVVYAGSAGVRGADDRMGQFLRALHAELDLRADAIDARHGPPGADGRPPLASLYLGGGTPSLLPADALVALVDHTRERFGLAGDAEITLEANPGPDERGDLAALRDAGVTRYSVGAQSLDPGALRLLGRRHTPAEVAETVDRARAAGIGSVSLDLLLDVPGQGLAGFLDTLEAALALAPDHLSLYALALDDPEDEGLTGPDGDHLPVRPGARRWRDRVRPDQDEDRAAAQYHAAAALLAEHGFRGYEIANWARPGHESRHNLAYWTRRPVEAVGPGAHAFDGTTRRWNAARLDRWLAALAPVSSGPTLPPGGEARLDERAASSEALMLGMRLDTGVALAALLASPLASEVGPLLAGGLLETVGGPGAARVRLTTAGRLISNEILARLV